MFEPRSRKGAGFVFLRANREYLLGLFPLALQAVSPQVNQQLISDRTLAKPADWSGEFLKPFVDRFISMDGAGHQGVKCVCTSAWSACGYVSPVSCWMVYCYLVVLEVSNKLSCI